MAAKVNAFCRWREGCGTRLPLQSCVKRTNWHLASTSLNVNVGWWEGLKTILAQLDPVQFNRSTWKGWMGALEEEKGGRP